MTPYTIGAIGGNAMNQAIGGAISSAYALHDRQINYKLSEQAAENAQKRQEELYNRLYSPIAKIQQLKEAGLSPSLFYENGGTQGASAPQGTGGTGIQTQIPISTFSPEQLAQAELVKSQARLNNARADELEGKNASGEAKVKMWLAQSGKLDAERNYTETLNKQADLKNYIIEQTTTYEISKAKHLAEEAAWHAELTLWEALRQEIGYNFDKETFYTKVEHEKLLNDNLYKDLLLKQSQIKLNEQQVELMIAEITKWEEEVRQQWCRVLLESVDTDTRRQYMKNQDKFWDKQATNLVDRLNLDRDIYKLNKNKIKDEQKRYWIDLIHTIIDDYRSSQIQALNAVTNIVSAVK